MEKTTNNSDIMSFNPENGLKEIQFMKYDYHETDQFESEDSFFSSLPINDILGGDHLCPKKLIIITAYRFNSGPAESRTIKDIEVSVEELQKKYPEYLILILQEIMFCRKPDAEHFCINLDKGRFKPYPYCKFNRFAYTGYFSSNEEVEDFLIMLEKYRFHEVS